MLKSVVITGCGIVSALGLRREELFNRLLAGESAVREMPGWTLPGAAGPLLTAPCALSQETIRSIDRKLRRSMAPVALFAALAAKNAAAESGLDESFLASGYVGCAIGSTLGSPHAIAQAFQILTQQGLEALPAQQFFQSVAHTAAFNVANCLGLRGQTLAPCSACASGLQAIGVAYDQIRLGRQTAMLAGGADEATPAVAGTFEQLFALAHPADDTPAAQAQRPFDEHRTGLTVGEGAGIFMLEEKEHALARGAKILMEIRGYATNASGSQTSQSDATAIRSCLESALADAALKPSEIDYINAHATGTRQGDTAEATALRQIFGANTPVSSLKGQLGHSLGASGAIELAATLEMARRHTLLPTANLTQVAEDCAGLDHLLEARTATPHFIVKDCFAFGGINAVLVGEIKS
ncbi:MAG: beta-ketoacyl-[acyl-carrier-protein] synthase family protein [Lentisphaeria bacterium]|nr:beta-ketoacyl-[acyl-carrier-protein] synthase family protein [Lentisphaeria bacterium]